MGSHILISRLKTGLKMGIFTVLALVVGGFNSMSVYADSVNNDLLADITVNKTATPLDANLETKINLTFPGKTEDMAADVVFVLDKSGFSAEKEIYQQAIAFVENLNQQATDKGIEIKVGVVLFNNIGNIKLPLTDVRTGKDYIIKVMNEKLNMGTNIHAGLIAGKKLLDEDTAIKDSRKHLVLISDGATYLWSKNDDYTKGYTRSFGNPAGQGFTNTPGYVQDWKGGIWEYMNRDLRAGVPDGEQKWGSAFASPASFDPYDEANKQKLETYVANLERRINEARQRDAEYEQYDYEYNLMSAYFNAGRKTTPITKEAIANVETAAIKTADYFDEIDAKYNTWVYYLNSADYNGSPLLAYLKRNSGGLSTDFANIEKQILNFVDSGSTLVDFVGEDFDFVNDASKISLKVGSETLSTTKISDSKYGFGDVINGKHRFELLHEKTPKEKLTLFINETVSPSAGVNLQYSEKLVNIPASPGVYEFDTNVSAELNVVDGDGENLGKKEFPKPKVTYEKTSKVVVKYIDINTGKEVEISETKYGHKGGAYFTDQKAVNGYIFVKDTGNTTGNFANDVIEVVYYYKKLPAIFGTPEDPDKISVPFTGKNDNSYLAVLIMASANLGLVLLARRIVQRS